MRPGTVTIAQARISSLPIVVLALLALLWSASAEAQVRGVQRPSKSALSQKRVKAVKQARAQGVKPERVNELSATLGRRASELGEANLGDAGFRGDLSTAPLRARLEVFRKVAKERGVDVRTFDRRLRGMLKANGKNRVAKPKKRFFEITAETFDLFPKIMGENVIWFAASPSPYHLHTLLSDQDGGGTFTHNTYGKGPLTNATIPREQYLAGVQLTGPEMDRFVRYLNAGVEHDKRGVYGFKTSSGTMICETACTNWATSAPVGPVERWIRSVDKRVSRAASEGRLDAKFSDGLHAALAKAADQGAREALLGELLRTDGLDRRTKDGARRLGKEFDRTLETFPNRPADLVGRESLASVVGVNRSQDPAKWMYDLFLSKRVPVIGIASTSAKADFDRMTFDLEIMGGIDEAGRVTPIDGRDNLGVVPAGRSSALD